MIFNRIGDKTPEESGEKLVDAIEDGKIIKVSEDYAKREGLLVLRRPPIEVVQTRLDPKNARKKAEERQVLGINDLRKPLKPKNEQIANELLENFHWEISKKRRQRNLTRKQVADAIGESDNNLKLIESGIVPMNNFILVNKLESYFGINLRKNKVASAPASVKDISLFSPEPAKENDEKPDEAKKSLRERIFGGLFKKKEEKKDENTISGDEIEIA